MQMHIERAKAERWPTVISPFRSLCAGEPTCAEARMAHTKMARKKALERVIFNLDSFDPNFSRKSSHHCVFAKSPGNRLLFRVVWEASRVPSDSA